MPRSIGNPCRTLAVHPLLCDEDPEGKEKDPYMRPRALLLIAILLAGIGTADAQNRNGSVAQAGIPGVAPEIVEILGISVEGTTDEYSNSFVQQTSRLRIGQKMTLPGDPALGDAIRAIYRLRTYEDVQIVEERRVGTGLYLVIKVREVPKLRAYEFEGIKKSQAKDLRKEVPLIARGPVHENSIARSIQIIEQFYAEKGFPLAAIDVQREEHEDNTQSLTFNVARGPKVKVKEVIVNGNEGLDDAAIVKAMETKPKGGWRFWRSGKLDRAEYEKDMARVTDRYNEKGYYDAEVLSDSVYIVGQDSDKPSMVVEIEVREGPLYHIRNIDWEGNTLFSDAQLTERLGFFVGDAYNSSKLTENLYGVGKNNDVSSLYYNSGHMRFNVQPKITVDQDSLDFVFDIFEGDVYEYGTVSIAGNTKTKDHVVRRELRTIPGDRFSRTQIQESIRRLMQLNYFTQESLAGGPGVDVREESKTVDLSYVLEETGTDQLELSGTWGRFGLILMLRFNFNNFSAQNFLKGEEWKPLPAGDGQRFSVGIQTNGRRYQQYSLSFTEPWFKGRPRQLGFSTSFSRISGYTYIDSDSGQLLTFSQRVFYEQRLKWPDPWFSTSTQVGFQYYNNKDWISTLPNGVSQEVTFKQTLLRNNLSHPLFPASGSKFLLSLEIAPPLGNLIQYHKWRMSSSWNTPVAPKIAFGFSADYGYIGSLTGDEVQFERFIVGGSPFETQGFYSYFGKDIVYMRGYPLGALGPRSTENDPFGGRLLNKYSAELRWIAIQSEQLQAAPYLFIDAANAWNSFSSYNPTDLYRSAGFGMRFFLPILGMVEMAYGYNYDEFEPINNKHDGSKKWTFQFSLGQGFGQ
ncbi:MAG: outer membrane protein assembly factor BamA [Bacteroidetes bacterium]|nr:outer membrane protein assembly factor BamA [Bacteroidota bacterium]